MARGGNRPGAGRPKGSTNNRTLDNIEQVIATGVTPLEYLTSVYQDINADEAKRIDAAKAAAPYVHAKLIATTLKGDPDNPLALTEIRRVIVRPGD